MKKKIMLKIMLVLTACLMSLYALSVIAGCTDNDEIVSAYAKLYGVKAADVSYKSYGEFDGTQVLIISVRDIGVGDAEKTEIVDGVDFHFNVWITFEVYHEGEFYTLQQAFDNGWLTHENLLTVRENHKSDNKWYYEICETENKS